MCRSISISYEHLAQWKGAIKLEAAGMKHSSRRSVTQHVREVFKLKRSVPRGDIIDMLVGHMQALLAVAGAGRKVWLEVDDTGKAEVKHDS